jgi:hypothetical protein
MEDEKVRLGIKRMKEQKRNLEQEMRRRKDGDIEGNGDKSGERNEEEADRWRK